MQMIQYYIQNQHETISSFPITNKESTKIGILEPGFPIEKKKCKIWFEPPITFSSWSYAFPSISLSASCFHALNSHFYKTIFCTFLTVTNAVCVSQFHYDILGEAFLNLSFMGYNVNSWVFAFWTPALFSQFLPSKTSTIFSMDFSFYIWVSKFLLNISQPFDFSRLHITVFNSEISFMYQIIPAVYAICSSDFFLLGVLFDFKNKEKVNKGKQMKEWKIIIKTMKNRLVGFKSKITY